MTEEQQAMMSLFGALAAMIFVTFILLAVMGCTTARQAPWIIEAPLHYAPPEPAPAGPPLPRARPERTGITV